MMVQSRRTHGDTHYNDGKKYFVIGGPLKADHLDAPNHAQLQTSVLPEDVRWKPNWIRRFALHPITFILLFILAGGLLMYAALRSL